MTRKAPEPRAEGSAAPDIPALDEAFAMLAAVPPSPPSEEFLGRVIADARRVNESRSRAAPRAASTTSRGDRRAVARPARSGLRAPIAAGAVGIAASALLGFYAGWADLAGVARAGFADADLFADEALVVSDWEDAL